MSHSFPEGIVIHGPGFQGRFGLAWAWLDGASEGRDTRGRNQVGERGQ